MVYIPHCATKPHSAVASSESILLSPPLALTQYLTFNTSLTGLWRALSYYIAVLLTVFCMTTSAIAQNQHFSQLPPALEFVASAAQYRGSVEWGDYDNDGDLDLLYAGTAGTSASVHTLKVYRNDGGGHFVDLAFPIPTSLTNATWGDYDTDGDLDILVGASIGFILYTNNGADTFVSQSNSSVGSFSSVSGAT